MTPPSSLVPRRPAAVAIALTLALLAALLAAAPAQAAVRHLGYQGGSGTGSGWLGDVETSAGSGVYAYCVDPYGLFPSGDTGGTGLVGEIPGTTRAANPDHNGTQDVTGHDIEKLNYALWNWGDATTNVQAAAMDAYIYTLSSSDHPGTGVDYFVGIRVPASHRAAVESRYRAIAADTDAHWNDAESLGAHATVTITDAATGRGYVDVAITPASATGTLTLTHATQDGTGATHMSVTNGQRIAVTGAPAPTHSYTIRADLTATGPYDYAKNVRMYTTPVNDQNQRTIRHGERSRPSVSAHDVSAPISVEFTPVVATSVTSELVNPGDVFTDRVNAFASTGTWYPGTAIVGDYTVYGPFADQPAPSADVPAGAPVAATGSATLASAGATDVSTSTTAETSGWYAWVWGIAADRQDVATQGVLPTGYAWRSVFADPAESSAVPVTIGIETDAVQKSVGLYSSVSDTVTVGHDPATGAWWTSGGAPVVVTLDGKAYWVPGNTAPAAADSAPAEAVALGSVSLAASAPGSYPSPSVTVPYSTAGFVVWQWSVHADPRVVPHTERWGEPSQVTRVLPPVVSTTARSGVAPGEPVGDTAHVTGPAPAQPVSLVFEAFRQQTDVATCTPETRVVDTHDDPIAVSGPGDFDSPTVVLGSVGTYYWIATLLAPDGTVIATGDCGADDETTAVLPFAVTTSADAHVLVGQAATDVATVTGPTPPGASLVFRAYRLDDADHPMCDAEHLVSASEPIALTGAGDYPSPPVTFTDVATYAWVETAYDAAGSAITAGTCGEKTELTTVRPATVSGIASQPVATPTTSPTPRVEAPARRAAQLAFTGSVIDPAVLGAVAAALLLLAAALLAIAGRRETGRREAARRK